MTARMLAIKFLHSAEAERKLAAEREAHGDTDMSHPILHDFRIVCFERAHERHEAWAEWKDSHDCPHLLCSDWGATREEAIQKAQDLIVALYNALWVWRETREGGE